MSRLQNHNWIGFNGEPITGRTPPQLIVYGPDLTGQQRGEVFHAYRIFCLAKQVALGDYHVRNNVLSDGSRLRIESINGRDSVKVWTSPKDAPEELWVRGFIFQPRSGMAAFPIYWGEPLTEANGPLGTPYGPNSQVLLRAKWDKKEGRPTGEFRVDRFQTDLYGLADWQGPDPMEDVLSWDAPPWASLTISNAGALSYNTASTSIAGSNRYRSRGYSLNRRIYSKLGVIATFASADGHVDGAAYLRLDGERILLVALRSTTYQVIGGTFTFVAIRGAERRTIGTYAMGARETNTQGWYFSANGRMARCVLMGKDEANRYYSFALHLDVSGDTFESLAASATEIPDTRKTSDNSTTVSFQYKDSVSSSSSGPAGTNPSRVEEKIVQITVPDDSASVSGAFAADFSGNIPLVAFVEDRMSRGGVVAQGYARNTYPSWTEISRIPDPTQPALYDLLTIERSVLREMDISWDLPHSVRSVLVKGGVEDRRIQIHTYPNLPGPGVNWIRGTGTGYERYSYERTESGTVRENKSTGLWSSATETGTITPPWLPELSFSYQGGQAGKLLDLDLRYGAATVYTQTVEPFDVVPEISRPSSGIVVTYPADQPPTSSSVALQVFRQYTKIDEVSLPSWSFPADPTGSFNYTAWSLSFSYTTDEARSLFYVPTITTVFGGFGVPTPNTTLSTYSVIGSMKTYYGETLSHAYFQENTETPTVAYAHLSGKDNDPITLVQIQDKDQPNFYRIGVV